MDKKLTDSEIVKALECCAKDIEPCVDCPATDKGEIQCFDIVKMSALDLINRLQTEKDNLIRTYSECQIANLQEFMHRVENKLANNTDISMAGYQSVIYDMEQTYKEMVGEDK